MAEIIQIPQFLLPQTDDMPDWAVVASDQYASDRGYWEEIKAETEKKISAYKLILPEAYAKDADVDDKIAEIHLTMNKYLSDGSLKKLSPGFILVERRFKGLPCVRYGIMASIDLETFSSKPGSKTPVRSSEQTISRLIQSKIKVRRGARIELSHTTMFYNDPKDEVMNFILPQKAEFEKLYDFELKHDGGSVAGYLIPCSISETIREKLYKTAGGREKVFSRSVDFPLLIIGDGHHSVTAAKQYWNEMSESMSDEEKKTSPLRYVSAELINFYSGAVDFKPVHRFIRVDDKDNFMSDFESYTADCRMENNIISFPCVSNMPELMRRVDAYASAYIEVNGGEMQFAYSERELMEKVENTEGGIGILFSALEKRSFFEGMQKGVNYPQKCFTIGKPKDKRYYVEAKIIG